VTGSVGSVGHFCECNPHLPTSSTKRRDRLNRLSGRYLDRVAITVRRARKPGRKCCALGLSAVGGRFGPSVSIPLLQCATEGEPPLANFSGIVEQLKRERDRVQRQLSGLNAALAVFAGVFSGTRRRRMSAKGRAKIAAAQRARWAKVKGLETASKGVKYTMSASARRKIAAAQRSRWAKVRSKQEKKAA